jgi:hypothetical protein
MIGLDYRDFRAVLIQPFAIDEHRLFSVADSSCLLLDKPHSAVIITRQSKSPG